MTDPEDILRMLSENVTPDTSLGDYLQATDYALHAIKRDREAMEARALHGEFIYAGSSDVTVVHIHDYIDGQLMADPIGWHIVSTLRKRRADDMEGDEV